MRAYWILPNRDQHDDVLASDGETTMPLRQVLDPRSRPDGFSHGVPTELLEKAGSRGLAEILFAQRFPAWNGDHELFSVLTTAGRDATGRVVHLGLLFVLDAGERPTFELSSAALSKEDQPHARALLARLSSPARGDTWAQSVHELADLPVHGAATNVALGRSVTHFESRYELGARGLTRKAATWGRATTLLLLLVLALVGLWLVVHATECSVAVGHVDRFPGTSVPTGVTT